MFPVQIPKKLLWGKGFPVIINGKMKFLLDMKLEKFYSMEIMILVEQVLCSTMKNKMQDLLIQKM
jgi:hypothetical protein